MRLNLEADIAEQVAVLNEKNWTALQAQTCMNVANAKIYAFGVEAERLAEFVRLGLITRAIAADYLNTAAAYNQLYFEYGTDRIQRVMADALAGRGTSELDLDTPPQWFIETIFADEFPQKRSRGAA